MQLLHKNLGMDFIWMDDAPNWVHDTMPSKPFASHNLAPEDYKTD